MTRKIRILFLSANPWTTSRILVDEEAREIFEKLQEGSSRDTFELQQHSAIRPRDLQRLLMMYEPHIVHFSGHASKKQKIILGGMPGRGRQIDRQGLVEVFALYKNHLRLVFLNACFTKTQARCLSEVIDYSVGTGKMIGDKGGVAFAGAFYRALGFGRSVRQSFESAKAELALTKIPRTEGLELFVREGLREDDPFPQSNANPRRETAKHSSGSFEGPFSDDEVLSGGNRVSLESLLLAKAAAQISLSESSNVGCFCCQVRSEERSYTFEHLQREIALKRETVPSALDQISTSAKEAFSSNLKAPQRKRADRHLSERQIQTHKEPVSLEVYTTLNVTVRKVVLNSADCVAQSQNAPERGRSGIRVSSGRETASAGVRRESAVRTETTRKSKGHLVGKPSRVNRIK